MVQGMETDFFCVVSSGPTIDGREIKPEWIDQMAETYDPATYGARIWLEHIRSMFPDANNPFAAYGDVTAVKAVDGPDGKRELHVKVDPTPELLKIKQARQKIYWSVEIAPNFAGTGKAYLVGLAVTDSPASLGTEAMKFTATTPITETLMSEPVAVAATTAVASPSVSPPDGESKTETGVFARLTALFAKNEKVAEEAAASATAAAAVATASEQGRADHEAATMLLAEKVKDIGTSLSSLESQIKEFGVRLNQALADPTPSAPTMAPVAGADTGVDY